jgi:hypothetical protein
VKPVTKVLIFGCSAVVVIAIVAVVAGVWFVRSKSGEWIAQGKAVRAEGGSFGLHASESQCLSETMTRYRSAPGMMGGVKQSVWLGGCLDASAYDPEFCTGVPPMEEIVRTAEWRNRVCAGFGLSGDPTCPSMLSEMQRYCAGEKRRTKASAAPHE